MKTIFTLIAVLSLSLFLSAQSAITFTAEDMPIPQNEITIVGIDQLKIKNPTPGVNLTWDYSTAIPKSSSSNIFYEEKIEFFTAAGVDIYIDVFKKFNPNFGYNISQEWDFNDNGIFDIGHYVYPQAYALTSFTGSDKDSLIMDEQGYLTDQRIIIKFPFTINSAWKSTSRRFTDFRLKVAAFNLVNTPCKHVFITNRQDSIVAWGKMRVPTQNGISKYYDVLMEKVKSSIIDSFYLGGAPAPKAILDGFGVTQGQKLDDTNVYNFYRKGQTNYFMRVNYGTDNTYTKPIGAFINIDGLETSASKDEVENFTSIVFPSPATANVTILLNNLNQTFDKYEIVDLMGKFVKEGEANQSGNTIHLAVHDLPNASYFVKLYNSKNNVTRTEQITVLH